MTDIICAVKYAAVLIGNRHIGNLHGKCKVRLVVNPVFFFVYISWQV